MPDAIRQKGRPGIRELGNGAKVATFRYSVRSDMTTAANVESQVFIARGTAHPTFTNYYLQAQYFSPSSDGAVEQELIRIYVKLPPGSPSQYTYGRSMMFSFPGLLDFSGASPPVPVLTPGTVRPVQATVTEYYTLITAGIPSLTALGYERLAWITLNADFQPAGDSTHVLRAYAYPGYLGNVSANVGATIWRGIAVDSLLITGTSNPAGIPSGTQIISSTYRKWRDIFYVKTNVSIVFP